MTTHLVSVSVVVNDETKKPWGYVIADGEWSLEKMLELILTGRCNNGDGFYGLDLHTMKKTVEVRWHFISSPMKMVKGLNLKWSKDRSDGDFKLAGGHWLFMYRWKSHAQNDACSMSSQFSCHEILDSDYWILVGHACMYTWNQSFWWIALWQEN